MEGTNLLGKSHKQYVQDQIKVRQEKLGKTTKDNNDVSWLNSKTSWVRLASSVDIKNSIVQEVLLGSELTGQVSIDPDLTGSFAFQASSQSDTTTIRNYLNSDGDNRLNLLGLDESFMGSTLSQKMVLHGGLEQASFGDTNKLNKKSGITKTLGTSTASSTSAYASKNGDFGLVAMPGIQSVDIKSKSMGSLREANISLRVNDAEQLELIETIYLRLGYSLFLEWGNSSYYNNEGEYVKGASVEPTLLYDFLNPSEELKKYPQSFIKKIEGQREKSNGNYDALFGRVSNFSWEFDPSGFYNVSLTIISWGDVIESLSIDALYPSPSNTTNVEEKDNSSLNEFIYYSTTVSSTREREYDKQEYTDTEGDNAAKKAYAKELINQKVTSVIRKSLSPSNTGGDDFSAELDYTRSLDFKDIPLSVVAGFGPNTSYQYLRFGDLLKFINDKLLLYVEDSNEPIISVDTSNTNYCYNPGINVSANPSKVMIRRDFQLSSEVLKGLNKVIREDGYDSKSFFRSKIFEGAIEGIDVELAPFDAKMKIELGKIDVDIDDDGVVDQKDVPTFKDIKVGNIMNIYLEKEFLYEQVSLNRDKESGKLSFYRFIKSLLDEINDCLGGVNKLDIRIVDDRIVQIYDQTPLYSVKDPNKNPTVFNIYGLKKSTGEGSFVTNFGLKTELTNEFASTVTIGAQSNGSVVGEDATMLSKWNFGLIDRFYPKKLDSYRKSNQQAELDADKKEFEAITQKMLNLYADYSIQKIGSIEQTNELGSIFFLRDLYIFPYFQTNNYSQYVKTQKQFLQSIIKVESKKQNVLSNQIGMLPINLNLEMDGLSGIRIYDQIHVDTRFLPSYYPDNLIFIIKGLSQAFNGNRWITQIDTIAQPKVQFDKELDLSLTSKDPEVESTFEEIAIDFIETSSSISNILYPPEQEMKSTNSSLSSFASSVYQTFENTNVGKSIQIGVIFLAYQEQNFKGFNHNFYGVQTDIQWSNLEPFINGSFRSTEGEGGQGERNTDFRWFASFKSQRDGILFVAAALQRKNWGDISKSLEKGDTDAVAKKYFGSWLFGNPNSDVVKNFVKNDNGSKLSKWKKAANALSQSQTTNRE